MGVVYRARDTKLGREVAIKVLPPHLSSDPEAVNRFVHEAKTASALNHSSIGVIHEIDEAEDGRTFIVMALYEGVTLRKRLDGERMSADEAVAIAAQIASGLAAAHEKGIVHRDIKPQNILLTRDAEAKIIDFGLAKLAGKTKLTRDGSTLGTAAYMSPEQARGEEVDHRSDIFSLGTILYEMLTGEPPFRGEHEAALLYEIVHEEPEAISEKCGDIDPGLCAVIERALKKDPAERYQSAQEMRDELKGFQASHTDRSTMWTYSGSRGGKSRKNLWIGIGAVAIIAVVIGYLLMTGREPAPLTASEMSLAVIDFRDMADEPDVVASAMITELLNIGLVEPCPIRVKSPEWIRECRRRLYGSADAKTEEGQDLEIARKSEATYVLTGRIGAIDQVRIVSWRLIDVRNGNLIKADKVDSGDFDSLADNIVAAVLDELTEVTGLRRRSTELPVSHLTTESPEAYEHYIRGKMMLDRGSRYEALDEFNKATELDSTFALAYLAIARLYYGFNSIVADAAKARAYADKALRYESRLGIKDRMHLKAFLQSIDRGFQMNKLKEILDLWPDDRETLQYIVNDAGFFWHVRDCIEYSRIGMNLYPNDPVFGGPEYISALQNLGHYEEALRAAERYLHRFPHEPIAWNYLGISYLTIGRPDSAETVFRYILDEYPDWAKENGGIERMAYCAYFSGNLDKSITLFENTLARDDISNNTRFRIMQSYTHELLLPAVYREAGRYSDAVRTLDAAGMYYFGGERSRWQYQKGSLLADIGWNDHALEIANEMKSYDRRSERFSLRFRGRAQVAVGDMDGVDYTVTQLDTLAQRNIHYKYFLLITKSYIAIAQNNPGLALEYLQHAGEITISFDGMMAIEYRTLLAEAYRLSGELEKASSVHKALLQIYGGHALSHFELGKLYEAMSRPKEARLHYKRFLEMWHNADEGLPEPDYARERLETLKGV